MLYSQRAFLVLTSGTVTNMRKFCRPNHGCKYVGQWRNGRREGEGTFTWTDGSKYVGMWSSNLKDGPGVLTLANGDTYDGQFKQDKKHGCGKFCWGEVRPLSSLQLLLHQIDVDAPADSL